MELFTKTIAVLFRFKENNWYGIAFAETKGDLFWIIDEHGDPFSCEIAEVNSASIMSQFDNESVKDSEFFTQVDDVNWVKPEWEGYPYMMQSIAE